MPEWTTRDLMEDPHLPVWPGEHCSRGDCTEPAIWRMGFKAYALGYPKRSEHSVTGMIPLILCGEHHSKLTAPDVFTDDGWETLQGALRRERRAVLDRSTLELIYYRIRKPTALDMILMEDRR